VRTLGLAFTVPGREEGYGFVGARPRKHFHADGLAVAGTIVAAAHPPSAFCLAAADVVALTGCLPSGPVTQICQCKPLALLAGRTGDRLSRARPSLVRRRAWAGGGSDAYTDPGRPVSFANRAGAAPGEANRVVCLELHTDARDLPRKPSAQPPKNALAGIFLEGVTLCLWIIRRSVVARFGLLV
jgi:hypothetical protein